MPTALELPRSAWRSYLKAAQRRSAARTGRRDELLLSRIREAAQMLKTRFGVRRVLLFGSLTYDIDFRSDSDVDLAVEGLPGSAYWEAWRCVEALMGDRPVDLIEVEVASSSLRDAIERQGVEL
jgi:predicted nucleotidyltransferase